MFEQIDAHLLTILLALLPGFISAEIVAALVIREDRGSLDRIIQALIYTFLTHAVWMSLFGWWIPDSAGFHLIGLGLIAVAIGLLATWFVNNDFVHSFLRRMRLTQTVSRPNEWYDAFYRTKEYVTVHLTDGRRVFGWPLLYPKRAEKGHLFLEDAQWLDLPVEPAASLRTQLLIDVADVRFVEFVALKESEDGNVQAKRSERNRPNT